MFHVNFSFYEMSMYRHDKNRHFQYDSPEIAHGR